EAALNRFGYDVLIADSGEAALMAIETTTGADISLVVLDLVMPGMDGIAVLDTLRARGVAIPVIVQTAQGGIETVVRAMRSGAFDFVVKPVSPDRLKAAVSN